MSTTQQDRVSYSHGFKVPGDEQYSSVNVSVSYSTDVRPDETPESAMGRARAFVLAQLPNEAPAQPPAPRAEPAQREVTPAQVQNETFDPNNPVHFRIAQNVLDFLQIKSEKARKYKIEAVMKDKRVGELRRVVEADELEYKQKSATQPFRVGRQDGSKSNWDGESPRRRW